MSGKGASFWEIATSSAKFVNAILVKSEVNKIISK